jgi:hypothetical protein
MTDGSSPLTRDLKTPMTPKKPTKKPTKKAAAPAEKRVRKPAKVAASVATFLEELVHPLKAEVCELCAIVAGAHPSITEQIKWNAPSFCINGDDRVTFRLQPAVLQLVFHRGAKVKSTADFAFSDDSGLVKWVTADRGVVTFSTMKEIQTARRALATLVARWMDATADQ